MTSGKVFFGFHRLFGSHDILLHFILPLSLSLSLSLSLFYKGGSSKKGRSKGWTGKVLSHEIENMKRGKNCAFSSLKNITLNYMRAVDVISSKEEKGKIVPKVLFFILPPNHVSNKKGQER